VSVAGAMVSQLREEVRMGWKGGENEILRTSYSCLMYALRDEVLVTDRRSTDITKGGNLSACLKSAYSRLGVSISAAAGEKAQPE
jgi:hypothetical protein